MSKQARPTETRAGAEERSSAGVAEKEADASAVMREDNVTRKEEQKHRIEELDHETLLRLLYQMILIRRFEEKCAESYSLGKIGGFCHLYIGQEAVAVGALAALRPDDYVLTSYRDHGHAIAKGTPADEIMAELYGKAGGCSKGKGGSMHLFDAGVNFLGGHGIVGGQIPLGTGIAFATKYKGTDQVTLCFFGEAAVNQGAFHESLNMAQLWKLPCIYICENNQYGMGTSLQRAMSLHDVSQKACAYEMASEFVDGMDVLAVREAVLRGVERARRDYSADAPRSPHLPLHGPLDVRPRQLPHARRDREVPGARPDQALHGEPQGAEGADGRAPGADRGRGPRRGRARRQLRRREPRARPRRTLHDIYANV